MKRNPAFKFRDIAGVFLLVPCRRNNVSDSYLHLNEMGAYVWNSAEPSSHISTVIEKACSHFGISGVEDRRKLEEFCDGLIRLGLLEEDV
jgi:hypothetical protein